ncbi:VOC family protein [Vreelandella neptunia]|uniref:VOC family protein n=1 Tax=Vreelandella neptunia TaxID=115551 RepID=UPI00257E0EEE|nr:VOC family protein [Halomonas sp.]|tara:strand:- start:1722 stop:2051 length:330 start_codon:yes stop_codon:yes gene_type:complete
MKLDLFVLRCSDLRASKQFYEQLGFSFVEEQHDHGPVHYSSENAGFVFELYPLVSSESVANTRLGFSVEGLDNIIPDLDLVDQYEFGGKHVYIVQDPDGRKVELSEQKP